MVVDLTPTDTNGRKASGQELLGDTHVVGRNGGWRHFPSCLWGRGVDRGVDRGLDRG